MSRVFFRSLFLLPAIAASLAFASLPARALAFRSESLLLAIPGGRQVQVNLRVPQSSVPARHPALLVFGGFQEARKVLELVHPDDPVVLASFDYPFDPPRKFEFPGSLSYAPEVKRMVRDTIAGIGALRQALAARADVDRDRISILGASFGAPFAAAAAGGDPAFSGVIFVHGFGDVPGTAMHQLLRRWEPQYGKFAYPPAWLVSRLGWAYLGAPAPETEVARLSEKQRVLMISADSDSFVPARASEALWGAIQRSRARAERLRMPGDHLQPGSDALIADILRRVTAWMKKADLLGSR